MDLVELMASCCDFLGRVGTDSDPVQLLILRPRAGGFPLTLWQTRQMSPAGRTGTHTYSRSGRGTRNLCRQGSPPLLESEDWRHRRLLWQAHPMCEMQIAPVSTRGFAILIAAVRVAAFSLVRFGHVDGWVHILLLYAVDVTLLPPELVRGICLAWR
jgi:hypothetical protein